MARSGHAEVKAVVINDVDPDDGNRWKCDACRLPIFATPFIIIANTNGHMHDQCANEFPKKFEDHPLHPRTNLTLHVQGLNDDSNTYCTRCNSKCGSRFYRCDYVGNYSCRFTLDLPCALPITILHQSHLHGLTATRGSSCSFICSACGTQHQPPLGLKNRSEWALSYTCSLCDFWIHPNCAVLPNAIIVEKDIHEHPLLLSYEDVTALSGTYWVEIPIIECAICRGESEGLGWYRCFHCNYNVHIKCVAYSEPPHSFKQELLQDAQVPGLLHLPMADEHQSVIKRIMNTTNATECASTSTTSIINGDNNERDGSKDSKVHEHPLVYHDPRHNNGDDIARVCNACVQLISPLDGFYSCSNGDSEDPCRDFFLHSCCEQLPATITTRQCSLQEDHTLSLEFEGKFPFERSMDNKYILERHQCNGSAYFCKECDVYLDVMSALMPALITHDAHAKSHILRKTNRLDIICSCCKRDTDIVEQIGYECNNCNNFFIHIDCALLPKKVSHEFDRHTLKLITTTTTTPTSLDRQEEEISFCEICEENIDTRRWFYGCKECDQSFHIDCIPYFDDLSRIKFGFTVQVKCHDCPLACVRALVVDGYRCGHCDVVIRKHDKIAFECAECYFRIHKECAEKLLLNG